VGSGKGPGFGPGEGGGVGGGSTGSARRHRAIADLQVEPEYSDEARKAKFQGTVVLYVVVDDKGLPRDIKVVRTRPRPGRKGCSGGGEVALPPRLPERKGSPLRQP
jgi:hypothetical protein